MGRSCRIITLCVAIFFSLDFTFNECKGQSSKYKFQKSNRKYYKKKYGSSLKPNSQCWQLFKKKYKVRNTRVSVHGKKPASVPLAEYDPSDKPAPKPAPVIAKAEEKDFHDKPFEEQTLDERHEIEDEILEKNHLPTPTSTKHEEIRKQVEQRIKGHKEGDPIQLDPLYFTFDDSEFAVVDMEPFLVAVEYALQGRVILIEGHTDSKGHDDYNVKLSIERVEKIRSLMHDMGVPDERISVVGYGEEVSEHDNSTEEGREKNRRVDFTVF
ncbi:OmpA family protein [Fulvivirga sp. M361]|uniref:OmpA family protein n=1 Tax=Fulvivirga sp. M361 TaxID=2594266 RepID=UPI00117BBD5C|nr:OmpA family protein [Fulvivirga sp. M361]TRX60816.1 OmpA family protein [Fulvivirga sp. M361]